MNWHEKRVLQWRKLIVIGAIAALVLPILGYSVSERIKIYQEMQLPRNRSEDEFIAVFNQAMEAQGLEIIPDETAPWEQVAEQKYSKTLQATGPQGEALTCRVSSIYPRTILWEVSFSQTLLPGETPCIPIAFQGLVQVLRPEFMNKPISASQWSRSGKRNGFKLSYEEAYLTCQQAQAADSFNSCWQIMNVGYVNDEIDLQSVPEQDGIRTTLTWVVPQN